MIVALTRAVPSSIVRCELTHVARVPIDVESAVAQHAAYEDTLGRLGCTVVRLPDAPEQPDSVFVEDTAVVLDELAVIARPGAESRRGETASVAAVLGDYRDLESIRAPATLDGGDVLRIGQRVYVGTSGRTNGEGARQLASLLAPYGYQVRGVEVRGCLHLKSAVTTVADDAVLLNPACVDAGEFRDVRRIEAHAGEPHGANALYVDETVLLPAAAPRTRERLEAMGFAVESVDVSELAKAEAGVTCCSLVFYARRAAR